MPIPPVPALDETITPGQLGHISDHEAIAAALNSGEIYNVAAPTGVGVTDTAAIHAARDSGAAIIRFQPGQYLVSGLTANVDDQRWELSSDTIIKLANAANAIVVAVTGDRVTVTGGKIDGNKANQTAAVGAGAAVKVSGDDCTVEGVWCYQPKSYGVYVLNCDRAKVRGNKITDSDYIGIFVEATAAGSADIADHEITSNTVDRTGIAAGSIVEGGIKVHGYAAGPYEVVRTRIANNTVLMPTNPTDDNAICIEVWGGSPRSTVVGNTTVGGSMGVSADTSDHSAVTGNTVFGPKLYGIELAASLHAAANGNTVDGDGLATEGIILDGAGSDGSAIVGNTISGVVNHGIHSQDAVNVTIAGNTIDHSTATADYAINVADGENVAVNGNSIACGGVGKKGVFLDTCTKVSVVGNTIDQFTETGVMIYATTAVTITDITIANNTMVPTSGSRVDTSLSGGAALGARVSTWMNNGEPNNYLDYANAVLLRTGTGTPEGSVTAGVGSQFLRTNGGAATTLYIKESGTGNTGWVAK